MAKVGGKWISAATDALVITGGALIGGVIEPFIPLGNWLGILAGFAAVVLGYEAFAGYTKEFVVGAGLGYEIASGIQEVIKVSA